VTFAPGITSVALDDRVIVISSLGAGVGVTVCVGFGVDVDVGIGVGAVVGIGVGLGIWVGVGVGVIVIDETDSTASTAFTTPDPEMVSSPGPRISSLVERSVVASDSGEGSPVSAPSTRAATPPTYGADAEVPVNLNGVIP
jgi:hypothetical protein